MQEYAVPALLKVPAWQLEQELALGALQVPAAQEVQEAIESCPGYWLYLPCASEKKGESERLRG